MTTDRTLRGKAAVVGVAETEYYKWGRSPDPEFKLAIEAVLGACANAGITTAPLASNNTDMALMAMFLSPKQCMTAP